MPSILQRWRNLLQHLVYSIFHARNAGADGASVSRWLMASVTVSESDCVACRLFHHELPGGRWRTQVVRNTVRRVRGQVRQLVERHSGNCRCLAESLYAARSVTRIVTTKPTTLPYRIPLRTVGRLLISLTLGLQPSWINHLGLWCVASATPDLRLPSQPQNAAAWRLVLSNTAWWHRRMCVNNLPNVPTCSEMAGTRTRELLSRKPTP